MSPRRDWSGTPFSCADQASEPLFLGSAPLQHPDEATAVAKRLRHGRSWVHSHLFEASEPRLVGCEKAVKPIELLEREVEDVRVLHRTELHPAEQLRRGRLVPHVTVDSGEHESPERLRIGRIVRSDRLHRFDERVRLANVFLAEATPSTARGPPVCAARGES